MKLIIQELDSDGLEQVMIPSKNTIVSAIRPHIYRHNFATGSLKVQIYNESDTLLAESSSVNISDIAALNYFHGYVRFNIDLYMQANVSYRVKLVGGDGYTFNESAYIGWANGYDLAKYPLTDEPLSDFNFPLDLEIWERTTK